MPATVNITVENDGDFFQVFQYTQADGTLIDITASSFIFGVRRNLSDTGMLFKVTSALANSGQIQVIDGPNGKFGLWIAKAQLLSAPPGIWAQSLIITQQPTAIFPPQLTTPIWNGTLTINLGASR